MASFTVMTLEHMRTEFTRSELRVDTLLENHDARRLNTPPAIGRWSALQCIEHLSLTNELNTGALAVALRDQPRTPAEALEIQTGLLWRILLKGVDPSTRLKGFAPRVLRPSAHFDPAMTRCRFLDTHATLGRLMDQCQGVDFNRVRYRHPVIRLRIIRRYHFCAALPARETSPATS
jgi:DinB family protein